MTILVRYFPANLTTEQYDEVLRRLDEAGLFPDAAMDLHISYGEEGDLASARSGTRRSTCRRSARS